MRKILTLCGAGLMAFSSSALGQGSQTGRAGTVELGIDAGLAFGLDDPTTTVVAFPTQDFRIGIFATDWFELEPRLFLNSVHVSDAGTVTTYGATIGFLIMPAGDRGNLGVYLRPFGGVVGASASVSGSGSASDNNGLVGGGVGFKIPFADRRLATRMEVAYEHQFGDTGGNQIGLLLGLSFFTR